MSKKFGFTKWDREEYAAMRADGRLKLDGVNCECQCLLLFHRLTDILIPLFILIILVVITFILSLSSSLPDPLLPGKYMPERGPLSVWCKTQAELAGL